MRFLRAARSPGRWRGVGYLTECEVYFSTVLEPSQAVSSFSRTVPCLGRPGRLRFSAAAEAASFNSLTSSSASRGLNWSGLIVSGLPETAVSSSDGAATRVENGDQTVRTYENHVRKCRTVCDCDENHDGSSRSRNSTIRTSSTD